MNKIIAYGLLIGVFTSIISAPSFASAADAEKGKTTFSTMCASCHGQTGAGDGPVSAAFPPDQRPANLATGQMKYATDESKFVELIKKGGAAVGLSALMPPQAGLSDSDISNLYAFITSLKK